jgi:uncharacterized protein (DUF924 family)
MEDVKLLNLFNLWYGFKIIPTNTNRLDIARTTNLDPNKLSHLWTSVWFAKKDLQIVMDKELKQYETAVEEFTKFTPIHFYEKMAMIILYDQIPRNIFRKTSKAYDYDEVARSIAFSLLDCIDEIGIQYRFTVLICLCHSENFEHQSFVRKYVTALQENKELENYRELINAMTKISDNHYIRVCQFGRIPERNAFVGRENTNEENEFLKYLT